MKRIHLYSQLLSRLRESRRFVQVLAGPRQVGKTTLVRQVMEACGLPASWHVRIPGKFSPIRKCSANWWTRATR